MAFYRGTTFTLYCKRLLGQNTSCLHIQALLEKGKQLFKVRPTHNKGNMFISVKHMERIFGASKGRLRKTVHATVTKWKDFLSCKVNSSRIHTSQQQKWIFSPQSITGIGKNSKQSSDFSRSKALLITPSIPAPSSAISHYEWSFENPISNRRQSSSKRKRHIPCANRANCSLPALLVPASTLPYFSTWTLPISSSSELFYYLNFTSSHFNFLNNTGYLKPQPWSNTQKFVGFKKMGDKGITEKKKIQFCSSK